MIELYNCDFQEKFFEVCREHKNIIVVSDPPFNVGYHYNTYKDNLEEEDYWELMETAFGCYPSVVIHYPEDLYKLSFQIGKFPEKVVSWVYNSNTPKQHRDICFFDVTPDFSKVLQPYKNLNDKRVQELVRGVVWERPFTIGGKLAKSKM